VTLFEKIQLDEALTCIDLSLESSKALNQLNLFES
jgi:hypothetical protein